ncbi:MAG TPA: NUDIX domain-containing protein [Gemmatimonadaceae bacterium]|nr:NUDIX domain-containing protein [Gemmatimonadaceae bacterium]
MTSQGDAGKKKRRKPRRGRRPASQEISAGGVVVRRSGAETFFLIIRDSYENWGFPKGHLQDGEPPERAALREVSEETGLGGLELRGPVSVVDWHFRFRGRLIHKVCHFFLMETTETITRPQRAEGITACRWVQYDDAVRLISYENAGAVLARANALLAGQPDAAPDLSHPAVR